MTPIPYLFFKGTAEGALRDYARIFGSPEPEIMRVKDAPDGESMGGSPDAVLHGAVKVGSGMLYASDWAESTPMAGNAICLSVPNTTEGSRLFAALSKGGTIEMAYAPTFWGPGFAAFTDRWGTRWMIDTDAQPATAPAPEAVA